MGNVQGSVKFLQEPVFERSEDDAPDATFSHKGGRKLQSKNIISLLTYIIEDLGDEIANGKKGEAQSQLEYEEEVATADALLKDLTARKVTLTGIISKRNSDKEEENKDMSVCAKRPIGQHISEHLRRRRHEQLKSSPLAFEICTPWCIMNTRTSKFVSHSRRMHGLVVIARDAS